MQKLYDYYVQLLGLKFPDSNIEDDLLADFYAELCEIDGYYAGLVDAMLRSDYKQEYVTNFDYLIDLRRNFEKVDWDRLSKSDREKYKECENYLRFLEKLPRIFEEATSSKIK